MKILNFGSCNIDYVYFLNHIVGVGETETTDQMKVFPGGKGLNQSIAAAKAGGKVYHAGCVGQDGDMLTEILAENDVDIAYIRRTPEKSGHAIIQVSAGGENAIFLFPGSNETVTQEYVDSVLEHFGKDDILLLQNEISNVDYIVERAYQKKMCILFNPSPFNEKIDRVDFTKLSWILLNEIEMKAISGCDAPQEGLTYFKQNYPKLKVVLTMGSRGCICMDNKCELYQPAFRVETVDTTAAGDTFTGYFVAEMLRQSDCRKRLKIASAASALAVSKEGAASSIPDRKEVLSALEYLTENKPNKKSEIIREQVDRYIEQNLKTAHVEELAKILGYSAIYTGTLIKKIKGKSFSKVVQEKRCSVAADKLLHTDLSVMEIAESVGYENKSFFRKIFQEKYHKNPLEFRRGEKK